MKLPSERADIGAVAIEDDGMYFSLGQLNEQGQVDSYSSPYRKSWPKGGYSASLITTGLAEFFSAHKRSTISAVAVSSFGLIKRDEKKLIAVPRAAWPDDTNEVLEFEPIIRNALDRDVHVVVEHDCTASALGEYRYSGFAESRPRDNVFVYVRVGEGIGADLLWRGKPLRRRSHMEAGHIPVAIDAKDKLTTGTCHVHGKCLEGLVSAEAILRRSKGSSLDDVENGVWSLVGNYVGQLCAVLTMTLLPDSIVIGGDTLRGGEPNPRMFVYDRIHMEFQDRLRGYPHYGKTAQPKEFIVPARQKAAYSALSAALDIAADEVRKKGKVVHTGRLYLFPRSQNA